MHTLPYTFEQRIDASHVQLRCSRDSVIIDVTSACPTFSIVQVHAHGIRREAGHLVHFFAHLHLSQPFCGSFNFLNAHSVCSFFQRLSRVPLSRARTSCPHTVHLTEASTHCPHLSVPHKNLPAVGDCAGGSGHHEVLRRRAGASVCSVNRRALGGGLCVRPRAPPPSPLGQEMLFAQGVGIGRHESARAASSGHARRRAKACEKHRLVPSCKQCARHECRSLSTITSPVTSWHAPFYRIVVDSCRLL